MAIFILYLVEVLLTLNGSLSPPVGVGVARVHLLQRDTVTGSEVGREGPGGGLSVDCKETQINRGKLVK